MTYRDRCALGTWYSTYTLVFVAVDTARTVAVYPVTQIVVWMSACVTDELATPGVRVGSALDAARAATEQTEMTQNARTAAIRTARRFVPVCRTVSTFGARTVLRCRWPRHRGVMTQCLAVATVRAFGDQVRGRRFDANSPCRLGLRGI